MMADIDLTAGIINSTANTVTLLLRGGPGNRRLETWFIDRVRRGFQATRYDRRDKVVDAKYGFDTPTEALRWLADGAWQTYTPISLQTPPARVERLLR